MSRKKKITAILLTAIAVLLILIVLPGCFYEVKEDEYACTARFSKIIRTVDQPGLYFKVPFIDTIRCFTTSRRPRC